MLEPTVALDASVSSTLEGVFVMVGDLEMHLRDQILALVLSSGLTSVVTTKMLQREKSLDVRMYLTLGWAEEVGTCFGPLAGLA
jgi:hypothetical protein